MRTVCGLSLLAGFLGIVPSLAVLLSYAHQQIPQPLTSEIPASHSGRGTEARANRKVRLLAPPAQRSMAATVASVSQSEASQFTQPTPDATSRKVEGTSPPSSGPGPRLFRRALPSATPGNNGAKQQTVTLIDPGASGQVSKPGDQNRKQALQQSATAAVGIYKRLSSVVDRH